MFRNHSDLNRVDCGVQAVLLQPRSYWDSDRKVYVLLPVGAKVQLWTNKADKKFLVLPGQTEVLPIDSSAYCTG